MERDPVKWMNGNKKAANELIEKCAKISFVL
jgi:hypothetical protein